jgi:MoaA/NifB/PqqE/SkfB family radical SAM enzyme
MFRNTWLSNKLNSAIIFVTFNCNSRCITCFNWKNLNKYKDLTLEEFEIISRRLPKLKSILLSGGEPFIRNDIVKLVEIFIKNNSLKIVGIPTNGLLPKKICTDTEELLKRNPAVNFEIACSLDGLSKIHDTIRGIPGAFDKQMETIDNLKSLRKNYKNLRITVNTVITDRNVDELEELIAFVRKLGVNDHNFDLLRGSHQNILSLPSPEKLRAANRLRLKAKKYYNRKNALLGGFFANTFYKWIILNQMKALNKQKWDAVCSAGETQVVVYSNGDLSICELLKPIGNLLKSDLKDILSSDLAKAQIADKCRHKCDCTHICYVSPITSNPKNYPSLFFNNFTKRI